MASGKTATGKFTLRFEHLPRVAGTTGATNETPDTWPAAAESYSGARESLSGGEQVVQGIRQSTGAMRRGVRGRKVPIRAVDRVRVKATGEVFNVTGVYRDEAETVLTVERAAF